MTRSTPHPWRGDHVPGSPTVVVGVMPGHRSSVVRVAAGLARRMQAELVCVWADAGRVLVAEDPDGTLHTAPLDPDAVDDGEQVAEEHELARDLAATLDGAGVAWRFVYTVGEASHALRDVARHQHAVMIAVGPRRPGLAGWMNHVVGGTVAGRLAHTQHLPVVVIPPVQEDA